MATAAGTTNKAPAHAPPHVHEVTFIGYPKLMFIWPLIAIGLLLWPFGPPSAEHSAQLEVLGWVYITVLGLVLLTMGVDVNRNQAVFWIVLIFALWILGAYLNAVRNIPLFGWIFNWFGSLNVQYDRSLGLATSAILGIPFVILFVYARLNDRWRITHNEFEHFSWGKQDESLGRGAKVIRTEYPDVFELVFGGAGTLIVFNANANQEIRRIPHVFLLPLVRNKLNKILESVSITHEAGAAEEEETAM